MVTKLNAVLAPEPECVSCGARMHQGSQAVILVYVPQWETQTVCSECYTVMLAGAVLSLSSEQGMTLKRARKLLKAYADHETPENAS